MGSLGQRGFWVTGSSFVLSCSEVEEGGQLVPRKGKPFREYTIRGEKQGAKDQALGPVKGIRSQGSGQGWPATRTVSRYHVREHQAGGGSGRRGLENRIPYLHSVLEHLIYT